MGTGAVGDCRGQGAAGAGRGGRGFKDLKDRRSGVRGGEEKGADRIIMKGRAAAAWPGMARPGMAGQPKQREGASGNYFYQGARRGAHELTRNEPSTARGENGQVDGGSAAATTATSATAPQRAAPRQRPASDTAPQTAPFSGRTRPADGRTRALKQQFLQRRPKKRDGKYVSAN